jgi:uncharacterized protein (DUF305 family)
VTATQDAAQGHDGDPPGGTAAGGRRQRTGPPTGWTLVALVVALCFLAGAVGWVLGQGRPPSADSADVGFLHDMRTHHENAVNLAQVELANGRDAGVKAFAEEILRFQSYEIGLMDRMLIEWGHRPEDRPDAAMQWMGAPVPAQEMPGIATPAEMARIRSAGADTDAVFTALMIDHHAAGVAMAEAAVAEAGDADVVELARRIADTQRKEIAEMTAAAQRGGLDLTPAGVVADVPHTGTTSGH